MGIKVQRKEHEPLPLLLRRFKKIVERSGKLRELRNNAVYQKPSEVRRRKELRRKKVASSPPKPERERFHQY